jgi:predicted ester cyclase
VASDDRLAANKALIRRIYDEGYNGGDPAVFEDCYTAGFMHHSKVIHDLPSGGPGELASMRRFRAAIPDVQFAILQQMAEDDWVSTRLSIRGTPVADFGTVRADGRLFDVHALALFRIEGDRVAEEWLFVDGGT